MSNPRGRKLSAPFPYFGGKGLWAKEIWERFGRADVYAEPFAGSLAVLLVNPCPEALRREVVCDTDGMVCNFWRAVRTDPERTASYADNPTVHQDLTARHRWLVKWRKESAPQLVEDPDWYDAQAAGWWAWGLSSWIGSGFCGGNPGDQIPEIKDVPSGRGVSRQRVTKPYSTTLRWFNALSDRLRNTIIVNRSWKLVQGPTILMRKARPKFTRCVLLDPPYEGEGWVYRRSEGSVARDSYDWAIEHGERDRIAYCCIEGSFPIPSGWQGLTRNFSNYGAQSLAKRDMILFSPACLGERRFPRTKGV